MCVGNNKEWRRSYKSYKYSDNIELKFSIAERGQKIFKKIHKNIPSFLKIIKSKKIIKRCIEKIDFELRL